MQRGFKATKTRPLMAQETKKKPLQINEFQTQTWMMSKKFMALAGAGFNTFTQKKFLLIDKLEAGDGVEIEEKKDGVVRISAEVANSGVSESALSAITGVGYTHDSGSTTVTITYTQLTVDSGLITGTSTSTAEFVVAGGDSSGDSPSSGISQSVPVVTQVSYSPSTHQLTETRKMLNFTNGVLTSVTDSGTRTITTAVQES